MDKNESLVLYNKGHEAWNRWANEMFDKRTKLIDTGEWKSVENVKTGNLERGMNQVTQEWIEVASSDFSKHNFDDGVGFSHFVFPGDAHFEGATFGGSASFRKTRFCGATWFNGARFEGNAQFREATFVDEAQFEGVTFSGNGEFWGTTFSSSASFYKTTFNNEAEFGTAKFGNDAQFRKTTFNSHAEFERVIFSNYVWFDETIFNGDTEFWGTTFSGAASFIGATFRGSTSFRKAQFSDAWFKEATFSDNGWFELAEFSGHAQFSSTKFNGNTSFSDATFNGHAEFLGTTFSDDARFRETTFNGDAEFERVTFSGAAWFGEVTFNCNARFSDATFSGDANFGEAKFYDDTWFDQATFEGSTSFSRTTFKKNASFVAIKQQNYFALEDAVFFLVPDFSQAHFAEAPQLDNSRFGTANPKSRRWDGQRLTSVNPNITARWRTLKRLAVQGHDHERELNFLAEEIKSLRGVRDWPLPNPFSFRKGEPICWPGGGRYWAGLLYQWFSDFGRSTLRPFLCWMIVMGLSALFYFHHSAALTLGSISGTTLAIATPICDPPMDALYLSVHNGLVIPGLGRSEKLSQSYACLYGNSGKDKLVPIMPIMVVFAGIAQTIISAVLIFLFLLALRNYFRIK